MTRFYRAYSTHKLVQNLHFVAPQLVRVITPLIGIRTIKQMALDEIGSSTWNWRQNALITVNQQSKEVTYTPEYYVLKQIKLLIVTSVLCMCFISGYAQKGYPEREDGINLRELFRTPPSGYGQVPFYWWQADTLTKERLSWQLNELAKMKITSLQINYSHTDDKQGLFWGSSLHSQPKQFSEEWWTLLDWFAEEANSRGMTVSVSDYTLGVGQGYAIDEVRELHPSIAPHRLLFEKIEHLEGNINIEIKDNLLSVVAISQNDPNLHIDLTNSVYMGHLNHILPQGEWSLVTCYTQLQPNAYNPLHPLARKEYVLCFFQRFEVTLPSLS